MMRWATLLASLTLAAAITLCIWWFTGMRAVFLLLPVLALLGLVHGGRGRPPDQRSRD
jgi:hypothetical protein